ncbi:hypothetical protein M0P65_05795 [Candidatus Gracilibacteria bacterium]|jgi:hypothetical protein|nr:hypothetical protein [Candidatus Gracilibacteria bacterium]
MKQTEIYYRKIKDIIKITKIENVLSLKEIRERFGNTVAEKYKEGAKYYWYATTEKPYIVFVKKYNFTKSITFNSVMTKQEFAEIINIMKEAGERLRKIIAENGIKFKRAESTSEDITNENKKINIPIKKIEGDNDFFKIVVNLNINEMIKIMPVPALNDLRKKIADEIIRRTGMGFSIKEGFMSAASNSLSKTIDNYLSKHEVKKEEVKTIKI